MRTFICILLILVITSCNRNKEIVDNLDVQGHRGCRGLVPENTIGAFERASDIGVQTLELDLVITGDQQVLISHEPFFNHLITSPPDSIKITKETEKEFNIYKMSYEEIKTFDVGIKGNPTYPMQKRQAAYKPLLREMVKRIESYKSFRTEPIKYNMEIKYRSEWEGIYHPSRSTFAELVIREIEALGIKNRTTIQCFDPETLRIVKQMDSTISISYLVEDLTPFERLLTQLGFKPDIYSPAYPLVSQALIQYCKKQEIKLIPWTVNDEKNIEELILSGVDGMISDFPDKVLEIYTSLKPADNASH